MAKANLPRIVDSNEVYSVTLNVPGENLSSIIGGLPADFTVEQAILFRLFRDAVTEDFNAKHFREWYEAFEEALTEHRPLKVKSRERIDPIPPLAPEPPPAVAAPPRKVVGKGRRKAAKKR